MFMVVNMYRRFSIRKTAYEKLKELQEREGNCTRAKIIYPAINHYYEWIKSLDENQLKDLSYKLRKEYMENPIYKDDHVDFTMSVKDETMQKLVELSFLIYGHAKAISQIVNNAIELYYKMLSDKQKTL